MERRQFVQLTLVASAFKSEAYSGDGHQSRKEVLVDAGTDRDGQPFEFIDATFQVITPIAPEPIIS